MHKKFNFLLFLICFLGVVCVLGAVIKWPFGPSATLFKDSHTFFESSHEHSAYALTESLIKRQTFELTLDQVRLASPDVGFIHGKLYSLFPPGVSLAIYPFYLLGEKYNLLPFTPFASVALFSLGSFVLLYAISREILKLSVLPALLAGIAFCVASSALSYSVTIYQHIYTVFFLLLAFFSAWKTQLASGDGVWLWSLTAWIACGVTIWLDYPNILLVMPIVIYHASGALKCEINQTQLKIDIRLGVVLTSVCFIGLVGLLGYWQYRTFGSWLQPSNTLKRYDSNNAASLLELQAALDSTTKSGSTTSTTKGISQVFSEQNIPRSLYELLVAPDKGLFVFSPIFILALLGICIELVNGKPATKWLLMLIGANLFVYMSFGDPWGGWAFGPRYLIPAMAFLAIFVSSAISYFLAQKNWLLRGIYLLIVWILFTLSAAFSLAGALTTASLPPKIEAIALKMDYGLGVNFKALQKNDSYSFVYQSWMIPRHFSLWQYYIGLVSGVSIFGFILLFIIPYLEKMLERREKIHSSASQS